MEIGFDVAIRNVKDGHKARRKAWSDGIHIALDEYDDAVTVMCLDGVIKTPFIPRSNDMLSDDWEILL